MKKEKINTPLHIAIADDNNFLIKTLQEKMAQYEFVKTIHIANDGAELIEKIKTNPQIDVILMDIEMPNINGIEATAIIKERYPQIKVIMITVFDDDEQIFKAIQAGADSYILKELNAEEIMTGIETVLKGGAYMTPSIALKSMKLLRYSDVSFSHEDALIEQIQLTDREQEVLEQLSKGLSYTKIAANLNISPYTVRKHIENIYKSLHCILS